jgi:hypothetical protein
MATTVTLVKLSALTQIQTDLTNAVAASASAAAASATLASEWASKTSAAVAGGEFSAKEYAQGAQAATGGSSKNWAQQTGADVTGAAANSRSAKSWAQEAIKGATLGGSAKDWAQDTASTVDGTSFSAKEYAQGTQAATGGSAKNWAQQTAADVTGAAANSRSAKSWAQDNLAGATLGGSSKDWAQSGSLPDGVNKSAKSYALDAGTSASAAATSAAQAAAIAAGLNYKGTVAGASVAATSTAAGDCYAITAAGTSQSVTWAEGDLAIYRGTSGNWDRIPAAVVMGVHAALRNNLTPRGGAYVDGTGSARIASTLTGQTIDVDPFSVVLVIDVPLANPAIGRGMFAISENIGAPTSPTRAFISELSTNGDLWFTIIGTASNGDYNRATITGFRALYAGKTVILSVVRPAAGNLLVYANAVSLTPTYSSGGTPPGWQTQLSSTYFSVGYQNTTEIWDGAIRSASLYNLPLTAADVAEINELNGAVPFRFQFGNINFYSSNFTANADAWTTVGATASGNIDSVNGVDNTLRVHASGETGQHVGRRTGAYAAKKRFRIRGSIYIPVGQTNLNSVYLMFSGSNNSATTWIPNSGAVSWTPNAAWQTIELDATLAPGFNASNLSFYMNNGVTFTGANSPTDDVFYLYGVKVAQLGAIVHLPMDDGCGRQFMDKSSNKLHAIASASGISHMVELDEAAYVQTALTANGELLDTAGVLRTDAVLLDVIVKNTTANQVYGFGIGMSSGVRDLTYETDIPANSVVVLPIKRADLAGLTVGTAPFGRAYYSAASWNSGSLNISIRYRRERDL